MIGPAAPDRPFGDRSRPTSPRRHKVACRLSISVSANAVNIDESVWAPHGSAMMKLASLSRILCRSHDPRSQSPSSNSTKSDFLVMVHTLSSHREDVGTPTSGVDQGNGEQIADSSTCFTTSTRGSDPQLLLSPPRSRGPASNNRWAETPPTLPPSTSAGPWHSRRFLDLYPGSFMDCSHLFPASLVDPGLSRVSSPTQDVLVNRPGPPARRWRRKRSL